MTRCTCRRSASDQRFFSAAETRCSLVAANQLLLQRSRSWTNCAKQATSEKCGSCCKNFNVVASKQTGETAAAEWESSKRPMFRSRLSR